MSFRDKRTQWKGIQLDYDRLVLDQDFAPDCCYCLTDSQAKALIAVIDDFRYATRWYTSSDIDRTMTNQYVNDIQRRLMMPCGCGETGVIYRWGTDGELERSNDGGDTWSGAPNQDPRNTSPLFPPPMGEMADKCPAADNGVTAIIVEVFEALTPEMTKDDVDSLIRTWIQKYIDTSNPILALITVMVNLIFGLIIDTLITALTTDVWNQLRCCMNDTMLDDFSYDHDSWEALRDCILENISGIAGIFLEHLIYLLGTAGTTNIIRSGLGTTSADCDCRDFVRIFVSTGGGTETSWDGEWLYASPVHDGDHYTLFVQRTDPAVGFSIDDCAMFEFELLTGTIDIPNSAMKLCHTSSLVPIALATIEETCCCQVAIRNFEDVTFTVRVRGVACS
jgi:hypothetical protein